MIHLDKLFSEKTPFSQKIMLKSFQHYFFICYTGTFISFKKYSDEMMFYKYSKWPFYILVTFILSQGLIRHFRPELEARMKKFHEGKQKASATA